METKKPVPVVYNNNHDDSLGESSSYAKPEESEKDSDYNESYDDVSVSGSGSK